MTDKPDRDIRTRKARAFSKGELRLVLDNQADAGLEADLNRLAGETTYDVDPLP